jgi:hypothetical protein
LGGEEKKPALGTREFRGSYQKGRLIELADHTMWRIPPGHEVFTLRWNRPSRVTVVPGAFAGYPYDLINHESGEKVPAKQTDLALWDGPDDA